MPGPPCPCSRARPARGPGRARSAPRLKDSRARQGLGIFQRKSANFRRIVLFCIKADFHDQIRILQHFSKSTRFGNLCTAKNPNFADFCMLSDFLANFQDFRKISLKFAFFRRDFHGILPEFHRNSTIFMNLILQFKICGNFRKLRIIEQQGWLIIPQKNNWG